ncbi:MAG: phosphatidylserine decarboxylase, partial [Proteobacteria bacterium]|nr:phosphatidylserine decarboxylase [Pseudomonadota bacterium]
ARNITIDTARQTIPSRPVTMPGRNYVVVSPTDCIMNPLVQVLKEQSTGSSVRSVINNPLEADTVIDVKSYPISLDRLLGNAPAALKQTFIGGSGLACVLMPNTYHHFHSPVDGEIIYTEIIEVGTNGVLGTYGYYDFPNWAPMSGDVGRPGTDFSQFEVFQRGVIIIRVEYDGINGQTITGYVASIPVGLDTIGSVVFDPATKTGAVVKKGYTRLGNFLYGGSLNILLFSKGISSGVVQTRLGNQITLLNAGTPPGDTE